MNAELEEIEISLSSNKGEVFAVRVYIAAKTSDVLYFESEKLNSKEFRADDLFSCMAKLRDWLDDYSLKPLCNVARLDVFPSAMSRQMSGGRLAYKHKLNHQCSRTDLVDIFQPAPLEMLATTTKQKEFHEKWMKSL